MTTAEHLSDAVSRPASTVSIAGVPWPLHKVVALIVGLLVFVAVGLATASAGPAVLSGAGVAALTWLIVGLLSQRG
ncbi:hypothetical protein [Mycolicibacterium iranicum]|uniref:Uncharacterized protein n=1 Tax=Mycolicibacterium iranicum TaxID=912594 RepID=A0A178LFB1_MYCIR|nr:hypothetical protein [Mycolicibacterium iranicum]OAN28556.1 hypothetical protein A4X20_10145 [Mycolicibacterium iranicum]